ncbi:MAG TPA: hypothetical protein PLB54_09045 [Nitrosomonas sp.]|nr:hypothetical protein [Nitrosomonas sp.]
MTDFTKRLKQSAMITNKLIILPRKMPNIADYKELLFGLFDPINDPCYIPAVLPEILILFLCPL